MTHLVVGRTDQDAALRVFFPHWHACPRIRIFCQKQMRKDSEYRRSYPDG